VPAAQDGVAGYIEAVAAAVAAGGYEIVFTSDDIGVLALSRHREEIGAIFPYAPHESVVRALDKLELTRTAARVGLATPATTEADAGGLAAARWPAVVKPRLHSSLLPGAPGRLSVRVVDGPAEARRAIDAIRRAGVEPILQELVAGRLMSCHAVVDREGRVVARAQQVSQRVWPADVGVFVRASTVPVDPGLAALVARLLRDLGWFGLASIQFLQPPGGGAPRLIDLNGRFYGSLALAIASGPSYPAIWARLATGRPLGSVPESRPGVSFQWLARDLRASLHGDGLRGVLGALLSAPGAVHSVWSRRDPWPAIRHYVPEAAVRTLGAIRAQPGG
jgi:predicted ATP-grasp superfamily ATP-dependent carboligase